MYVFRENHRVAPAGRLLADLADAIRRAASSNEPDHLHDALLRAGELECALADSGRPSAATQLAGVTDCLASALARGDQLAVSHSCLQILNAIGVSSDLVVKTPEGFAYYGLHSLDYARLVEQYLVNSSDSAGAAVIGIRTIGTTLSAIVAAEFRRHHIAASRTTVRPHGHPFRRECRFSQEQQEWIGERKRSGDRFFVVDEGPGLSGSSFLSVATALQIEGVDPDNIVFLCSRIPDISSFCSETSREQWPHYQALAASSSSQVLEGLQEISGGRWREGLFSSHEDWPASWTYMERRKFLSIDASESRKFEGHGKYGEAAFDRARRLADAGFGPKVLGRADGYTRYQRIQGTPLIPEDLDEALLERIAQYCAFRAAEFNAEGSSRDAVDLEAMTRVNLAEEFGHDVSTVDLGLLHSENPVITDSRMSPYAWVRDSEGKVFKTNGSSHGDDHFFPGPCDIAWDLAGAIIEWQMGDCVANQFLHKYVQLSGDEAKTRIAAFLTAYAACRMGYCKMAAESMRGTEEEARLRRDYLSYREVLANQPATPELARAA
jgi:hypothetical protein